MKVSINVNIDTNIVTCLIKTKSGISFSIYSSTITKFKKNIITESILINLLTNFFLL